MHSSLVVPVGGGMLLCFIASIWVQHLVKKEWGLLKGLYRDSNLSLLGHFSIGYSHQIYMISSIPCNCNLTKRTFAYITSICHWFPMCHCTLCVKWNNFYSLLKEKNSCIWVPLFSAMMCDLMGCSLYQKDKSPIFELKF